MNYFSRSRPRHAFGDVRLYPLVDRQSVVKVAYGWAGGISHQMGL